MGKRITDEQKAEFRDFCRGTLAEAQEDGDGAGYFTLESCELFEQTRRNGEPLWEFHAANYNPKTSHDIYELFESVGDEFTIEQHGYDEFYVSAKGDVEPDAVVDEEE